MMRSAMLLFLVLTVAGCVPSPESASGQRSDLHRDVEGYGIASCLFHQIDPDLQRQGDAWASTVIQTMKGDLEHVVRVAEAVKAATVTEPMAVVRVEGEKGADTVTVPMLYCYNLVDVPSVRAAIQQAMIDLQADDNKK